MRRAGGRPGPVRVERLDSGRFGFVVGLGRVEEVEETLEIDVHA